MCAHMMSGQAYSAFPGMPLMLLGLLLSFVLLAVVIGSMAVFLRGKTERGTRNAPQPHDEPYTYNDNEPREPALEVLRERYARGEIDP
jgi:uncharacterized membrane protein